MGRTRFFILDRPHPASLTLRDYSKVVAGYKQSLSKKNQTLPKMSGGSMPSLRARWSELSLSTTYLRALCLGLAVCLSLSTLLPAQGTGGRILGLVSDPTGAVLSGVKVTATNEATGVTRDSVSNDSGDYVFPDLPVGTYYAQLRSDRVQEGGAPQHRARHQPGHHAEHDHAIGRAAGNRRRHLGSSAGRHQQHATRRGGEQPLGERTSAQCPR